MQKNGIWKIYYDVTPDVITESYDNVSDQDLMAINSQPDVEIIEMQRVSEGVITPEGQMVQPPMSSVTVSKTLRRGKVQVDVIAPEDFLISSNQDSSDLQSARFSGHKITRTASELIEDGYDPEIIESAPSATESYETSARFESAGETTFGDYESEDPSQKLISLVECYMQIDLNEDGISELAKITAISDGETVTDILDVEEVEEVPFVSFSTINMPHKHWGLSVYDRLKEIQDGKTSLWRNILDNLYLQNNREKEVVDGQVNMDDLLVSRPGGLKRVKRAGSIRELEVQPIGADGFNMLNYFDSVRTGRVGVSPDGQGQNMAVSNDTAHGVERIMSAKEMLTGLMIRLVAETGLKPAYRLIRDLLVRHQEDQTDFMFRDQWVQVNPQGWGQRSKMTVKVGTGTGDDARKLAALQQVLQYQSSLMANPKQTLVDMPQVYKALDDFCDASGVNGALGYFVDPSSPQGQQQQQQVSQQSQAAQQQEQQMQQMLAQAQQQLSQAEMMKGQASLQAQQVKMQSDMREQTLKAQIEKLKEQLDMIQSDQKLKFDYDKLATEEALRLTELETEQQKDLGKQYLENKKIDAQVVQYKRNEEMKEDDEEYPRNGTD